MKTTSSLGLYTRASTSAAGVVISAYSTSFQVAVRMLGARHRSHIRHVYALARIADELVDGVGKECGLNADEQEHQLRELEHQTYYAMERGYSTNPIVHAFAVTARQCRIERGLLEPFFASMLTDIEDLQKPESMNTFSREEHARYVYGSAEVIGLMCLRVFTRSATMTPEEKQVLEDGARSLGAAFQNINFLRDIADDAGRLHRDYLGVHQKLSEEMREVWLTEIRAQLGVAERALPLLPGDARRGVRCALDVFAALTVRLARIPVSQLYERRVRVPDVIKLAILARASTRNLMERA